MGVVGEATGSYHDSLYGSLFFSLYQADMKPNWSNQTMRNQITEDQALSAVS